MFGNPRKFAKVEIVPCPKADEREFKGVNFLPKRWVVPVS